MASQGRSRRVGQPQYSDQPRPAYKYNRRVREDEFVQRVRRHQPSSLVPLVASVASHHWQPESWRGRGSLYAPWVLAEIARTSLVQGTEFGRKAADARDLEVCCGACQAISDRELEAGESGAVGRFLLRLGAQQHTFQQRPFNDLSRTLALFEQTQPARPTRIIKPGWAETLLGCSLSEYVGAAFLLHTSALRNEGTFDLAWLRQPNFDGITAEVGADVLENVIRSQYITDRTRFAELQAEARARAGEPPREFRRYSFNPLASHPVLEGLGPRLVIPVPGYLIQKASPLGLFYSGIERWGKDFADDIGYLFEAYVGRVLAEIPGAQIVPEIAYGPNGDLLSVDWFVICEESIVLVEVKSTRPTERVRLGSPDVEQDLTRMLGKGVDQLNRSARLVLEGDRHFSGIPTDRPMVGLLVTMEPFHTVNTPFISGALPESDIPYRVCSALELEEWVSLADASPAAMLLNHLTDPERTGWSIHSSLAGHELRNCLTLEQGWAAYPWGDDTRDSL